MDNRPSKVLTFNELSHDKLKRLMGRTKSKIFHMMDVHWDITENTNGTWSGKMMYLADRRMK